MRYASNIKRQRCLIAYLEKFQCLKTINTNSHSVKSSNLYHTRNKIFINRLFIYCLYHVVLMYRRPYYSSIWNHIDAYLTEQNIDQFVTFSRDFKEGGYFCWMCCILDNRWYKPCEQANLDIKKHNYTIQVWNNIDFEHFSCAVVSNRSRYCSNLHKRVCFAFIFSLSTLFSSTAASRLSHTPPFNQAALSKSLWQCYTHGALCTGWSGYKVRVETT